MDSRVSDWIRRGELLFDQAHEQCAQLEEQITHLQRERDARRRELRDMARILSAKPGLRVGRQLPAALAGLVQNA